jgi:hypothetical protein
MRFTKWYRVTYQGRKRFETVNLDEASGFATRLWNANDCKGLPIIEEFDVR